MIFLSLCCCQAFDPTYVAFFPVFAFVWFPKERKLSIAVRGKEIT